MPNTEHDPIDRGFEWRLKAALDRVTPPSSNPRYASTVMGAARVWPLGPALVAAAATIVLLAVTATAATGSANPVVWAERAGSTMQSVGHTPEAAPSPEPSPETPHSAPAAPAQPTHDSEHDASQAPEPKESPEPTERSEPSESSSHSGPSN
ncbi:MAG TPA: hypothetical protein VIO37_14015 [Candidatus Dormibacteraeota bacterium]|jgi:outer membrane biosynthesis protein TonB